MKSKGAPTRAQQTKKSLMMFTFLLDLVICTFRTVSPLLCDGAAERWRPDVPHPGKLHEAPHISFRTGMDDESKSYIIHLHMGSWGLIVCPLFRSIHRRADVSTRTALAFTLRRYVRPEKIMLRTNALVITPVPHVTISLFRSFAGYASCTGRESSIGEFLFRSVLHFFTPLVEVT